LTLRLWRRQRACSTGNCSDTTSMTLERVVRIAGPGLLAAVSAAVMVGCSSYETYRYRNPSLPPPSHQSVRWAPMTYQAYAGQRRPREQVAVLLQPESGAFHVRSIDGSGVPIDASRFHLLPGRHSIEFAVAPTSTGIEVVGGGPLRAEVLMEPAKIYEAGVVWSDPTVPRPFDAALGWPGKRTTVGRIVVSEKR
jgi:hypothetical protein